MAEDLPMSSAASSNVAPLVDAFEEDQPLSQFLVSRFRKKSVEIVLTEVTDDLFAAISRHTLTTDPIFITFPKY